MYEIRISKTEDVKKVRSKHSRVADSGNPEDGGAVYAWVDVETTEEVTVRCMYEQAVDELDLIAVIKAINNIK